MSTHLHLPRLLYALAALSLFNIAARADYATTYANAERAVGKIERQVESEIRTGDRDGFLAHFELPESDLKELGQWFEMITALQQKDALERVTIDLPILGATDDRVLVHYGRFDVIFKTEGLKRYGWPPVLLERHDKSWRFVDAKLKPLPMIPETEVVQARFETTPEPAEMRIHADTTLTVKNTSDGRLSEFPLYFRHPLHLEHATMNGKPLAGKVVFGTIADQAVACFVVHPPDTLEPGASIDVAFRYSDDYAYHGLGRKPVGFVGDRGFVLWESGWYPWVGQGAKMFPYEMTIAVPKGFEGLTSGDLLGIRTEDSRRIFSYRCTTPAPPYFLWGRYQETRQRLGAIDWVIWTPADGSVDPKTLSQTIKEAGEALQAILPEPAFDLHRVVAVTRFGGYGAPGNLLIQDDYFKPERARDAETLDFIAHELSHSWVNTLAEPAGPPASLLAEGLATYCGAKAVERSRSSQDAAALWRNHQKQFENVAARAVAPADLTETVQNRDNPMFRAVAYDRGAFMYRELEGLIGVETVLRALRDTLLAHRGGTFTLSDFTQTAERLAQCDLRSFWTNFLREAGAPDYVITNASKENGRYHVVLENRGIPSTTPFDVAVYDAEDHELERRIVKPDGAKPITIDFGVPDRIARTVIDPDARVLQSESRNDVYFDKQLSAEERGAVDALLTELLHAIEAGDGAAMDRILTKDESVLEGRIRARILKNVQARAVRDLTRAGEPTISQTEPARVSLIIDLQADLRGEKRALRGEFDFRRETDGWKAGPFSIR